MSFLSGIGSAISNLGAKVGAPDLGIGAALGGGAPGLLQGVNPSTYAGVPVNTPSANTAAILPATTPQQAAALQAGNAGSQNDATNGGGGGQAATGGTSAANPYQSQIEALLGHASNLVDTINGLYGTLYGDYGTGVQNAENVLQQGYLPQYAQVGTQANQLAQQLDYQNIANGTATSSVAGNEQQNLGQNASNEDAGILAAQNKDQQALAQQSASQMATYKAQQAGIQNELGLYQQTAPQDTTGSANYQLSSFISGLLSDTIPGLQGQIAQNQTGGQLYDQLQSTAPSQIYNPQQLQSSLNNISQSSLPGYLQNTLSAGQVAANGNPGDLSYWTNYMNNLSNTNTQ